MAMLGHAMDRGGLKDSKNASNSFFRKSAAPGFDVLVLICFSYLPEVSSAYARGTRDSVVGAISAAQLPRCHLAVVRLK